MSIERKIANRITKNEHLIKKIMRIIEKHNFGCEVRELSIISLDVELNLIIKSKKVILIKILNKI